MAVLACRICGKAHRAKKVQPGKIVRCRRCGSKIVRPIAASSHLTGAFSLAALILYWPANMFPILQMNMYGATSENTVWEGCVKFYETGDYVIALIVFLASILIPLMKVMGLFFLVISTRLGMVRWARSRTLVFKGIELIGRWAMLDVFVLAILVSLVRLQRIATILPGKGLLAFVAVVVFTNLASECFDPESIWSPGCPR